MPLSGYHSRFSEAVLTTKSNRSRNNIADVTCDILIRNIKGLVQVRPTSEGIVRGTSMAELPILPNAWLTITGSSISGYGAMNVMPAIHASEQIDATGRFVF